jgi:hypothetical protein
MLTLFINSLCSRFPVMHVNVFGTPLDQLPLDMVLGVPKAVVRMVDFIRDYGMTRGMRTVCGLRHEFTATSYWYDCRA